MIPIKFTISALILATLACGVFPQPPATPITRPAVSIDPSINRFQLITVTGDVNVCNVDTDVVVGWLKAGDRRWAVCAGKYCYIQRTERKIWRGCTDDNPSELGCKSK